MAKERFSQINTRQKTIIGAVIVVVLIIAWQVMSLFPSSSSPAPAAVPKATMTANNPNQNATPGNGVPAGTTTAPVVEQLRQAQLPTDPQLNKWQTETEQKYVGKLNDLEELKIQKQIAETNQAISAAKLATVTAEKDISDLLTKPAAPIPLPGSAYADQLNSSTTGQVVSVGGMPIAVHKQEATVVDYSVISVSMQLNKWSAVLGYQGRLFNVTTGDILPPDHSVVTNINRNGVTLRKDGESRKISMISSI